MANVSATPTAYIISSLLPYTKYSVIVKAWTSVGAGPASSPITQTTAQAGKGNFGIKQFFINGTLVSFI